MLERSAQAKRGPLTQSLTSPYGKVKRSAEQSASSGAGQDTGTSLQAAGRPDYRRCRPQDSPGMSATHVQVGPSQRGPLTQSLAPPRSKARGPVSRSASSGAVQDMRASLQAAGRPDYRRCCPQDSLGMSATHVRVGPSQRGPLTQNLAPPRSKARGVKGAIRILRRRARRGNIAVSGRAPGLPALLFAGQPRNERHPCQRSPNAKEAP